MTDDEHTQLQASFPVLVQPVSHFMARRVDRDRAWLIAGAIQAYTGVASIPPEIVRATQSENRYPKVVGSINDYLRGERKETEQLSNLGELFGALSLLPDWNAGKCEPTRMMDYYEGIEQDYQVGNVLLMAEVGSVSRHGPASAYYERKYRIHIKGGLKDITAINPEQQEVIYAPGSAYLVESRRTGKPKIKKGNQAHEHIYLRHVTPESDEYRDALRMERLFDLRDKNRHGNAL